MEGRRREEAREATSPRTEAMCNRAREMFSGIVDRRLRYPWAQSPPRTEKLGQRQLTTCLEDRAQAPSKKDPTQNCPPAVSDDPSPSQGGRAYCWDIMASAQSKKATVMSCRQSQVQRAASLSCVFMQSQVTGPLHAFSQCCWAWARASSSMCHTGNSTLW